VEMKELGPSAGKYRPNRVETEMEQVLTYNYFSPGLMVRSEPFQAAVHCWSFVHCIFTV